MWRVYKLWRVYKSTLDRANGAIAHGEPIAHKPLTLTRGGADVVLTPTYIQVLHNGNLRVVSAQITLFLEGVDNG